MQHAHRHRRLLEEDYILELITEMATGGFEGSTQQRQSAIELIARNPQLKAEFETLYRHAGADVPQQSAPTLRLLRGDQVVCEVVFETVPGRQRIDGISPGNYILRLSTGLVIWQGKLTAQDLIWTEAFGAKSLDLAAEAGDIQAPPARELALLDGSVILRTFPA